MMSEVKRYTCVNSPDGIQEADGGSGYLYLCSDVDQLLAAKDAEIERLRQILGAVGIAALQGDWEAAEQEVRQSAFITVKDGKPFAMLLSDETLTAKE